MTMPKTSGNNDAERIRQRQTTGIRRPDEHDVLMGRGGLANNFCGNKQYRENVDQRKAEYVQSKRSRKTEISRELVREWRSLAPPGRFLDQDEDGLWYEIGEQRARRKTSQLLREDAPAIREKIEANGLHDNGGQSAEPATAVHRENRVNVENLKEYKPKNPPGTHASLSPVEAATISAPKQEPATARPSAPPHNQLANIRTPASIKRQTGQSKGVAFGQSNQQPIQQWRNGSLGCSESTIPHPFVGAVGFSKTERKSAGPKADDTVDQNLPAAAPDHHGSNNSHRTNDDNTRVPWWETTGQSFLTEDMDTNVFLGCREDCGSVETGERGASGVALEPLLGPLDNSFSENEAQEDSSALLDWDYPDNKDWDDPNNM